MADGPGSSRKQVNSIGYTTQQMLVNGQQTFTQLDAEGNVVPLESGCVWAVLSGGGTIDQEGTYTAPATNPNCINNPTIGIVCNGVTKDTLPLAVSVGDSGNAAVIVVENAMSSSCELISGVDCHALGVCTTRKTFLCNGVEVASTTCGVSSVIFCTDCEAFLNGFTAWCDTNCPEESVTDIRSGADIAAGCCPMQLL
jgi:hypothetical protein